MNCPVQEFNGNSDQSSVVHHWLDYHFYARFVRFVPLTWVGQQCMRVELHGCEDNEFYIEEIRKYVENGAS